MTGFIFGLVAGAILGYFVCALVVASNAWEVVIHDSGD